MFPLLLVVLLQLGFSGLFVAYSILMAITVLYYLLLSPYVRAFLLLSFTRILDQCLKWGLQSEQEIKIGSIGFAFLSGKLYVNHISYRSKNLCVGVLQATIRFNWWYKTVRQGENRNDDRLPCRLSIELVGVECILHHNSNTYDHLQALILKQVTQAQSKSQQQQQQQQHQHQQSMVHQRSENDGSTRVVTHPPTIHRAVNPDDPVSSSTKSDDTILYAKQGEQSMATFYRWFPVTKLTIKSCAVMIGNLKLPQFLVVHLTSAHCLHSITAAQSPHCYYQLITEISKILDVKAYLSKNPEYIKSEEIIAMKRTLDAEDYFAVAIGAFGKFLADIDQEWAFMQSTATGRKVPSNANTLRRKKGAAGEDEPEEDNLFLRSYKKSQQRSIQIGPLSQWSHLVQFKTPEMKKEKKERKQQKDLQAAAKAASTAASTAATTGTATASSAPAVPAESDDVRQAALEADRQRERELEAEMKREREKEVVFECADLSIEYVYDITTLLTAYDVSQLLKSPVKAAVDSPFTRLKVTFQSAVNLRYGPSIDNQRVLFMSYFKPWDYRNQVIYTPRVGEYRAYAAFTTQILFAVDGSQLRIPFREASKLAMLEAQQMKVTQTTANTGWLDLHYQADSSVIINMNLLATDHGTDTTIQASLNRLVMTPSFTKQPLLTSESCIVAVDMNYPQQWNDLYDWKYTFNFHAAQIWFLSAHIGMFSDIVRDWTSFSEYQSTHRKIGDATLAYFHPMHYTVQLNATDYEFMCNVNENNVIDALNSLDDNTHVSIRGPDMQWLVSVPMTDFKARALNIIYQVHARNLHAHLRLPINHPLTDLLETNNDYQILYMTSLAVQGSRMYHYKYNPDYRDSHSMQFMMEGLEWDCYGHYLRYLSSFYDNYIGSFTHYLTSSAFILTGYRNIIEHVQNVQLYDTTGAHNAYETFVTIQMENITVKLPDHLFSPSLLHQPKLRCYECQLEVRLIPQYTDVFLCLSPITLSVPLPVSLSQQHRSSDDHQLRSWNERETHIQCHEIQLSYHSSKGDLPRSIIYRSSYKILVGELVAQLLPSQLFILLQSISNITLQYDDAIDYSKPRASLSNIIPSIDSNNDTLELISAKKQLTSFLQDQINGGLVDATVELQIVSITANLLHPPLLTKPLTPSQTRPQPSHQPQQPQQLRSSPSLQRLQQHEHRLSVTRLLMMSGIQVNSTTLITPKAHAQYTIEIPSIQLQHLLDTEQCHTSHSSQQETRGSSNSFPSWLSICSLNVGLIAHVSDHRADLLTTMRKQQDFIYSQMHQEAATEENDTFSWHETNATKVPYMYNEEWGAQINTYNLHNTTMMYLQQAVQQQQQSTQSPTPEYASTNTYASSGSIVPRLRSYSHKQAVQLAGSNPHSWPQQPSRESSAATDVSTQSRPARGRTQPFFVPVPVQRMPAIQQKPAARRRSAPDRHEEATRESSSSFQSCQSFSDDDERWRDSSVSVSHSIYMDQDDNERNSSPSTPPQLAADESTETWQDFRLEGETTSPRETTSSSPALNMAAEGQRSATTSLQLHNGDAFALPVPRSMVSCLPSTEVHNYLPHFSLHSQSRCFAVPFTHRHQHPFAYTDAMAGMPQIESLSQYASASSSPQLTSMNPSSVHHPSIEVDLAGTAAAAYLELPIAEFTEYTSLPEQHEESDAEEQQGNDVEAQQSIPRAAKQPSSWSVNPIRVSSSSHWHHTTASTMSSNAASVDALYRDELDEEENPTFTNTRRVMIDAVEDLSVTITPAFIAALDHYLPLIQPTHSTIEDTLDELHKQFTRAFGFNTRSDLERALEKEKPFTNTREMSLHINNVSIDLLQSALSQSQGVPPLVYSTMLSMDAIQVRSLRSYALPEGFGSLSSGADHPSLIDLASPITADQQHTPTQPPTIEIIGSFARMQLFSCILNSYRNNKQQQLPSITVTRGILVPVEEMAKALPSSFLETSGVFVTCEVSSTQFRYTKAVDIVVHNHSVSVTPIKRTSSSLFTFDQSNADHSKTHKEGQKRPASAPAHVVTANTRSNASAAHTRSVAGLVSPPTESTSVNQSLIPTEGLSPPEFVSPFTIIDTRPSSAIPETPVASKSHGGKPFSFVGLFRTPSWSPAPATPVHQLPHPSQSSPALSHPSEVELVRMERGEWSGGGAPASAGVPRLTQRRQLGNMEDIAESVTEDDATIHNDDHDADSEEISESKHQESKRPGRNHQSSKQDETSKPRKMSAPGVDAPLPLSAPAVTHTLPTPATPQPQFMSPPITAPNTPMVDARSAGGHASSSSSSSSSQASSPVNYPPYSPASSRPAYHHHVHSSISVSTASIRLLSGCDAPQRLLSLACDWYTAAQRLDVKQVFSENDATTMTDSTDKDANKSKSTAAPSAAPTSTVLPLLPSSLESLIPGGPLTSQRRYRWQTLLSFSLQHLQHSRVLEASRMANLALTELDQIHLLQWYCYQSLRNWRLMQAARKAQFFNEQEEQQMKQNFAQLRQLLNNYDADESTYLPALMRHISHTQRSRYLSSADLPPSALAPHLHSILHQNAIQSEDVNYLMSVAPLTITMRKLLKLPTALMRRLNFKMQRVENNPLAPPSVPGIGVGMGLGGQPYDSLLDVDMAYEKLFSADKLKLPPLAAQSLHYFSVVAPQAAKLKHITSPAQLSPVLWKVAAEHMMKEKGSRFDLKHRTAMDQQQQQQQVNIEEFTVRIISTQPTHRDHQLTIHRWNTEMYTLTTPRVVSSSETERKQQHHDVASVQHPPVCVPSTPPQPSPRVVTSPLMTPLSAGAAVHLQNSSTAQSTITRPVSTLASPRFSPINVVNVPIRFPGRSASPLPLSSPTTALSHPTSRATLIRVQEVICINDCQSLWIELGPSIHTFLSSLESQRKEMAVFTRTRRDISEQEREKRAIDQSPPPVLDDAQLIPSSSASSSASRFSIVHVHAQFSLAAFSVRLRLPNTGSVNLLASQFCVCVGRYIPCLRVVHQHQDKQSEQKTGPPPTPIAVNVNLGADSARRRYSKSKPKREFKQRQTRRDNKGGTSTPATEQQHQQPPVSTPSPIHPPDDTQVPSVLFLSPSSAIQPVSSVLLRIASLDVRLLDAESVSDLPFEGMVNAGPSTPTTADQTTTDEALHFTRRSGKENVLGSFSTKRFTVNAQQIQQQSPLDVLIPIAATNKPAITEPQTQRGSVQGTHTPTELKPGDMLASTAAIISAPQLGVPGTSSSKTHSTSHSHSSSSVRTGMFSAIPAAPTAASSSPLTVIISGEHSVMTLPFYELEQMHVADYLSPWKPTLDILSSKPTPITAASATDALSSLPTLRVTCQLQSVSLVLLPLPSVMITYHLDRFWTKVQKAADNQLMMIISLGDTQNRQTDKHQTHHGHHHHRQHSNRQYEQHPEIRINDHPTAAASMESAQTSQSQAQSVLPVNCHKITLHSTNVRKRGGAVSSSVSASAASISASASAASTAPPSAAGSRGGVSSSKASMFLSQQPSVQQHVASLPGGLGAVLYSKMQFVLDFALPTFHASLSLDTCEKPNAGRGSQSSQPQLDTSNIRFDGQLDPAVAAELTRLSSEQVIVHRSQDENELIDNGEESDSSDTSDDSDDDSSLHSQYSPSTRSPGRSTGSSNTSTPPTTSHTATTATGTATTRSTHRPHRMTAAEAAAMQIISGVIAIGSMSNALNENVLNRLLHLQSTLNTEVNQLIDKLAAYSQSLGSVGNTHTTQTEAQGGQGAVSPIHKQPPMYSINQQLSVASSVWDRYCLCVSMILNDIHLTAGLDRNLKHERSRHSAFTSSSHHPSDSISSVTSQAVEVYFHSSWDPLVELSTGTISLILNYSPRQYRAYQHRQKYKHHYIHKQHRRQGSFKTSSQHHTRAASNEVGGLSARDGVSAVVGEAVSPLSTSDIVVELICHGVHSELSAYAFAYERSELYSPSLLSISSPSLGQKPLKRRGLIEAASMLRVKIGLDSASEHVDSAIHLQNSLMKITAITPLIGSVHALIDRYVTAYQHYQQEAEKLHKEEEYHDPMVSLRQIRTAAVWSSFNQKTRPSSATDEAGLRSVSREYGGDTSSAYDTATTQDIDGSLARAAALLDRLSQQTHYLLHFSMNESEIVVLFDREGTSRLTSPTTSPTQFNDSFTPSNADSLRSAESIKSFSFSLSGRHGDNSREPQSSVPSMTAVVLSLAEFQIQTEYLPAAVSASVTSSLGPTLSNYRSVYAYSYAYSRAPLNLFRGEFSAQHLELSFLPRIIETDDLKQLAQLLGDIRQSGNIILNRENNNPNNNSNNASGSAVAVDSAELLVYQYNRVLIRRSGLTFQISLPIISAVSSILHPQPQSSAAGLAYTQHQRNMSISSTSSTSTAPTKPSHHHTREVTMQIQTTSSGCEVDLDPTVIHHLYDLSSLIDLFSSFSQAALDQQMKAQTNTLVITSPPRSRPLTAHTPQLGTLDSRSSSSLNHRRTRSSGVHSRNRTKTSASKAASNSPSRPGSSGNTKQRQTKSQTLRKPTSRSASRTSAASSRRSREPGEEQRYMDDEEEEIEGQQRSLFPSHHSRHRSYLVAPSTPQSEGDEDNIRDENHHYSKVDSRGSTGTGDGPSMPSLSSPGNLARHRSQTEVVRARIVDIVSKMDIVMEVEMNILAGQCSLHSVPNIKKKEERDKAKSSLYTGPTRFAHFTLPALLCTYVAQHNERTEHLLVLDVDLPSVTLTPAILLFYQQFESESLAAQTRQRQIDAEKKQQQQQQQQMMNADKQRQHQRTTGHRRSAALSESSWLVDIETHNINNTKSSITSTASSSSSSPSALYSFCSQCAALRRCVTVTLRIRPTSLSFICPDQQIALTLGFKRPFDICIAVAAFPSSSSSQSNPPNELPSISVTAHMASTYVQLQKVSNQSQTQPLYDENNPTDATTGQPSSAAGTGPAFLAVRLHHARFNLCVAYGLDALKKTDPCRCIVFSIDHLAPGVVNISACSQLLIFIQAWALETQVQSTSLSVSTQSSSTGASASPFPLPSIPSTVVPLSFTLLSVGKIRLELNMLDIDRINNRSSISLSRFTCRAVDLGGSAWEQKPFLFSAELKELLFTSEPDLDGLEGSLACARGFRVRLLRLPLATGRNTQMQEQQGLNSYAMQQQQQQQAGAGEEGMYQYYLNEEEPLNDTELSSPSLSSLKPGGGIGRSRFTLSVPPPSTQQHLPSVALKRMVNKLEFVVHPIQTRFSVAGGRIELLRGSTSTMTGSIQDQFYPTAPLDLFAEEDEANAYDEYYYHHHRRHPLQSQWQGRWVTQTDLDLGDRLLIAATSEAIPYFINIISTVIQFLQSQITTYPIKQTQTQPTQPAPKDNKDWSRTPIITAMSTSTAMASNGDSLMIDDGSGHLKLTGQLIRVELTAAEERDAAVIALFEYTLSLTKELESKHKDARLSSTEREGRDREDSVYSLSTSTDDFTSSSSSVTIRVLLLDVGAHRLDEEEGRYQYVPVRMNRPYTEGIFISRITPANDEREILKVPGFVIEMETVDESTDPVIRSRFSSFWDKALTVNVDPRMYKFLSSTFNSFIVEYETAVANVHRQAAHIKQIAQQAAHREQKEQENKESSQLQPLLLPAAQPLVSPRSVRFHMPSTISNSITQSLGKRLSRNSQQSRATGERTTTESQPSSSSSLSTASTTQQKEHKEKEHKVAASYEEIESKYADEVAAGSTLSGTSSRTSPQKLIDPLGIVDFNPQIHVLDNTSSGVSSRRILELLGMKGETNAVPQATHSLTLVLDSIMQMCHSLSRAVDSALDRVTE